LILKFNFQDEVMFVHIIWRQRLMAFTFQGVKQEKPGAEQANILMAFHYSRQFVAKKNGQLHNN